MKPPAPVRSPSAPLSSRFLLTNKEGGEDWSAVALVLRTEPSAHMSTLPTFPRRHRKASYTQGRSLNLSPLRRLYCTFQEVCIFASVLPRLISHKVVWLLILATHVSKQVRLIVFSWSESCECFIIHLLWNRRKKKDWCGVDTAITLSVRPCDGGADICQHPEQHDCQRSSL